MDRCGSPLWPRLCALLLLLTSAQVAVASGQFELQVNSFQNLYGELFDGRCCTGRRSGPDGRCVAPCRTFFRACVQQYAARHSSLAPRSPCVLGNASTLVLGGNELKAHGTTVAYGDTSTRIAVPFKFAWPRSFTLVLEAWHQKNASTAGQPSAVAPEGSGLIMQTTHPGMVLPGVMWQNLHGHGPSMVVQYRIRVTCDENYFGSNCTRLCKPQNDYFGHYTCDTQGNKICREGWTGAGCKNAICRQGCSTEHGSCDVPGECKCSYGWQGTYCDRCTTYPGCVHGTCQKPWDCNCNVNWGGMMCDKDLNYCGTRNLCLNGGTCINTQPDDYMCRCPDGYSGKTCKIVAVEKACLSSPCANGGSCTDTPQGFECSCPSSWTGPACTQDVDDCVSAPCAHGGTCQDTPDGFHCFCPSQWSGLTCQVDVDECKTNPCVHARFCKNLFGSYYCSCLPGWFGQDCDIGESACHGHCLNGGTCKLSERGPECICPEGFLGVHCEIKPNACASLQCPHGMHCLIQSDTLPRCVCPPDSEHRCQEVDLCEPNPCQNGGLCSPLGGDYVCRCSDDYEGKNCSVPHDRCQSASCKVIDSCTLVVPSGNGPVTIVSSTVCGQHGRCVSLPGANFSCVCDLGFTGSRCHENINDCAGKNCLNGATCVDGVNSFQCICPDGWNGDFCQNDVDDCIPNPCQHGGACADLVNDFNCTCQGGWKGRTCHSRTSHCDASTCNNGGTCFEEGASFQCLCPPGWNGVTCSATQNNSCTPSPCENGATCIGAGDSSFICVCSEGWEGPTCSNNIDDCSSRPCSNGGRCIDGVNWYMCECAPGFAGPDCRININECQSSPCMSGGTCIDKINGYTCVCPPGKTGLNCMRDVELERTCRREGTNRYHSSTWMEDCNICQCSDGFKSCTKVWCGGKPCILSQQVGFGNSGCAAGHSCIPELPETCLMEPCHHIGRCLPSTTQPPTVCLPGIREQPFACTRIELVFERARVLTGTTVELVCSDLRNTTEIRGLAWSHHVYITCTLEKYDVSQAYVDVTISSDAGAARIDRITVVESRVVDAVWRLKLEGSKHMIAVTNVHTGNETPGQLVFILSVALALALLLLLVVVFMWYLRRRRIAKARAGSPHNSPRHNNAEPHPPTCFIYNPIPRHGQDRPMLEANKELDNKLLGSGDDRRTRNLELTEFCVGKQSLLEPFGKETGSIPPPFFGKDALSPGEMEPLRTNLKCSVHSIEVDV